MTDLDPIGPRVWNEEKNCWKAYPGDRAFRPVKPDFDKQVALYKSYWSRLVLSSARLSEINSVAHRLIAPVAKARYLKVEAVTDVPWYMIAVIHEREASQSWAAALAQGDPWNRRSTHVPKGQGPYKSWEEAAIAALKYDHLAGRKDWDLGGILYLLEQFNGWGYWAHNVPSAYVWSATNAYSRGKYVADGVWSSTAVDKQLGAAAVLKKMAELDSSIKLSFEHTTAGRPATTGGAVPPVGSADPPRPSARGPISLRSLGESIRGWWRK